MARLIWLGVLLVALAGWALAEYRGRLGLAMAWGMIFLGVMAGYGLWRDLRHEVVPRQMAAAGRVEVPRAADGHYYLRLEIGGRPVTFLVDTGASNVVLAADDARRLGIDPARLVYAGQAQTANGLVRSARVTLEDVRLGPWEERTLPAQVTDGALEGSLLGMDYLGRFRIEIAAGRMVLSR